IERFRFLKLRDERSDAGDRSGKRGGEETDRCEVGEVARCRLCVLAIEIEGVSQRLETVKGEAERKGPVPLGLRRARPCGVVLEKERHVLERREQSDVEDDAEGEEQTAQIGARFAGEAESDQEVTGGGEGDQEEVEEVPLGVEEIIGEKDDCQGQGSLL